MIWYQVRARVIGAKNHDGSPKYFIEGNHKSMRTAKAVIPQLNRTETHIGTAKLGKWGVFKYSSNG